MNLPISKPSILSRCIEVKNLLSQQLNSSIDILILFNTFYDRKHPAHCVISEYPYKLEFDLDSLKDYSQYINHIIVHEICHAFATEHDKELGRIDNTAEGHNKYFLELMELCKKLNLLDEEEWNFHKNRHVAMYLKDNKYWI